MLPSHHQIHHLLKLLQLVLRHMRHNPMLMTKRQTIPQLIRSSIIRPSHANPQHAHIHPLELDRLLRYPGHHQYAIVAEYGWSVPVRLNRVREIYGTMTAFTGDLPDLVDVVGVLRRVEGVVGALSFGFLEGVGREIDADYFEAVGL